MSEKKIPIYQIIESDLLKDILNEKYKQHDALPSEYELCAKYNCTRMTVRQAINNLVVDGYVYSKKGKGNIVTFNKREMERLNDHPFYSFASETIGIDEPLDVRVIHFEVKDADELIMRKLTLAENDKVYYIELVRSSGNAPMIFERLYLPIKLYPNFDIKKLNIPFYDFIEKEMKFNIRNCISSIEARALAPKVAEILNTQVNEPALYMSSISYLNTGEPFVYYRQYFLGTHFRFKHNFSRK